MDTDCHPDVMQVCRNGHVVADLVQAFPARALGHCHRCGAATLDCCPTCGQELTGAVHVPGLVPIGHLAPPAYCGRCGAAFPWTERPGAAPNEPIAQLESILRPLPAVIRQLRDRHADRPPFRVSDEHDLVDLLRALLPLHFERFRVETRTPRYSAGTRTDLWLDRVCEGRGVALTCKHITPQLREPQLAEQLHEDVAYYEKRGKCAGLVCLGYDPLRLIPDPARAEMACSRMADQFDLRLILAS